jgi:hypothetical protein
MNSSLKSRAVSGSDIGWMMGVATPVRLEDVIGAERQR